MPGVTLHESRFYRFPERWSATTSYSATRTAPFRTTLHRILPDLPSGRDEPPLQLRPAWVSGGGTEPAARAAGGYGRRVEGGRLPGPGGGGVGHERGGVCSGGETAAVRMRRRNAAWSTPGPVTWSRLRA